MRSGKKYLAIFAFSLILGPICAAHTDSASWKPTQPVTIGGVQIKPGDYRLKANEGDDELDVLQGKAVIATTVCYWKSLPAKAADTDVKADKDEVTEVQFKGRSEAIVFFGD